MAQRPEIAGQDISARWRALAEQRLDHLTELFDSGRWRRYHSESVFLENVQEAKRAVATWQALELREAQIAARHVSVPGLATATVDIAPVISDSSRTPIQVRANETYPDAAAARRRVLPPAVSWENALDADVVSQRYPLLQKAG